MNNIFETYLSNHPVEPDANPVTIIKSMAFYIEAVEYEKEVIESEKVAVETAKAVVDAEVAEKSTTLIILREMLKVETDADILKEVERLKALDK